MRCWQGVLLLLLLITLDKSHSLRLNSTAQSDEAIDLLNTTNKTSYHALSSLLQRNKKIMSGLVHTFKNVSRGVVTKTGNALRNISRRVKGLTTSLLRKPVELSSKFRRMSSRFAGWSMRNNSDNLTSIVEEECTEKDDTCPLRYHTDCTAEQISRVENVFQSIKSNSDLVWDNDSASLSSENNVTSVNVFERSLQAGWVMNRELVQRFVMASGWSNTYHGQSVEQAVLRGMDVRIKYNVKDILLALPLSENKSGNPHDDPNLPLYLPLSVVESGASYCSHVDKFGRPIVNLKLAMLDKHRLEKNISNYYSNDDFIHSMLHTLERAEKKIRKDFETRLLSCKKLEQQRNNTISAMKDYVIEKGKFVAIIDMTNVSMFSSRPSVSVAMEAVSIIKYAYPSRLASLYIVNAGYIFSLIWRLVQPTLSATSIGKIIFIPSIEEAKEILPEDLGKGGLDVTYGGHVQEFVSENTTAMFQSMNSVSLVDTADEIS